MQLWAKFAFAFVKVWKQSYIFHSSSSRFQNIYWKCQWDVQYAYITYKCYNINPTRVRVWLAISMSQSVRYRMSHFRMYTHTAQSTWPLCLSLSLSPSLTCYPFSISLPLFVPLLLSEPPHAHSISLHPPLSLHLQLPPSLALSLSQGSGGG